MIVSRQLANTATVSAFSAGALELCVPSPPPLAGSNKPSEFDRTFTRTVLVDASSLPVRLFLVLLDGTCTKFRFVAMADRT